MTDEEYLRACGWDREAPAGTTLWFRTRNDVRYGRGPFERVEDAVETQLAEDRARYNFVRERSEMHGGLLCEAEK